MAAHSSMLAWEISWTEEPGGLQFTESKRVGHDLATENASTVIFNIEEEHAKYYAFL